jgi:uncharacterized protein
MVLNLHRAAKRFAAGLVSVLALGFAGSALAEPALWALKDKDSTIYLFGTVHVLKPGTQWRSARIDKAIADSADLTLEVVGADDPAVMQPLVARYGLDQTKPLSSKVSADTVKRAAELAQAMGMPPQALEMMRPWLVGLTVGMSPIIKAGYDPKSGVETVLSKEMKAAGKAQNALETPEQQIRFFADLPADIEAAFLTSSVDEAAQGPAKLDTLVAAWAAGDLTALESAFISEMKEKYPSVYDVLLVKRNEAWAKQLKTKLDGSGVSFVAVGSGHLVGPESVQAQLAKLGLKVERVK